MEKQPAGPPRSASVILFGLLWLLASGLTELAQFLVLGKPVTASTIVGSVLVGLGVSIVATMAILRQYRRDVASAGRAGGGMPHGHTGAGAERHQPGPGRDGEAVRAAGLRGPPTERPAASWFRAVEYHRRRCYRLRWVYPTVCAALSACALLGATVYPEKAYLWWAAAVTLAVAGAWGAFAAHRRLRRIAELLAGIEPAAPRDSTGP